MAGPASQPRKSGSKATIYYTTYFLGKDELSHLSLSLAGQSWSFTLWPQTYFPALPLPLHKYSNPGVQNPSSCPICHIFHTLSHWWALDWAGILPLLLWFGIIIKAILQELFSYTFLTLRRRTFTHYASDHLCQTSSLVFSSSHNSILRPPFSQIVTTVPLLPIPSTRPG